MSYWGNTFMPVVDAMPYETLSEIETFTDFEQGELIKEWNRRTKDMWWEDGKNADPLDSVSLACDYIKTFMADIRYADEAREKYEYHPRYLRDTKIENMSGRARSKMLDGLSKKLGREKMLDMWSNATIGDAEQYIDVEEYLFPDEYVDYIDMILDASSKTIYTVPFLFNHFVEIMEEFDDDEDDVNRFIDNYVDILLECDECLAGDLYELDYHRRHMDDDLAYSA